jgi:transcriptional regulator with PAS, ATPase and Fis domain
LTIPPLRKRSDDIELLARHFVARFSREMSQEPPTMGPAFLDALIHHDWPGNVRELEKCLKRAIVLAQGDTLLRPEHLPAEIASRSALTADPEQIEPLRDTLAAVEAREIARAMQIAGGNKSQAARLLKISYPNLLKKIRHYGLL